MRQAWLQKPRRSSEISYQVLQTSAYTWLVVLMQDCCPWLHRVGKRRNFEISDILPMTSVALTLNLSFLIRAFMQVLFMREVKSEMILQLPWIYSEWGVTAVAESPECSKEFIVLIWNYLDNVCDKDKYFVIGGGYQRCIVFISSPKLFELFLCSCALY